MSATGVWIVGVVPDGRIADLLLTAARSAPSTATAAGPAPSPPTRVDMATELNWWRSKPTESLFHPSAAAPGSWSADDDAYRLSAFLDNCRDGSDPVEALRDAVMDEFPPTTGEDLFAAVARKAGPFSALAYALGPDATLQLPGWFGDFLLDADEVRTHLPAATEALTLTGATRQRAVERIHAWMTGLGDDPDHDAEELLDGPLRVLRHAARTGRGAAAQVRWY